MFAHLTLPYVLVVFWLLLLLLLAFHIVVCWQPWEPEIFDLCIVILLVVYVRFCSCFDHVSTYKFLTSLVVLLWFFAFELPFWLSRVDSNLRIACSEDSHNVTMLVRETSSVFWVSSQLVCFETRRFFFLGCVLCSEDTMNVALSAKSCYGGFGHLEREENHRFSNELGFGSVIEHERPISEPWWVLHPHAPIAPQNVCCKSYTCVMRILQSLLSICICACSTHMGEETKKDDDISLSLHNEISLKPSPPPRKAKKDSPNFRSCTTAIPGTIDLSQNCTKNIPT